MARPRTTDEARTETIQIRVTPTEKAKLDRVAWERSEAGKLKQVASLCYEVIQRFLARIP